MQVSAVHLSILINGHKSSQQRACTAYIASSLFIPDDNSILFGKPKVVDQDVKEMMTIKNWCRKQAVYTPVSITAVRLDVTDSAGRELTSTPTGLTLKFRDVYWLGNGKIMGKEYFVDIKVIDTPISAKTDKRSKIK